MAFVLHKTLKVYSPISLRCTAKVSELLENGQRNRDFIFKNFFHEEVARICNIQTGGSNRQDNLAWFYTRDGNYSVRSGYWVARELKEVQLPYKTLLTGSASKEDKAGWRKCIWNIRVPNKFKLFLWRACSNIFPCAYNFNHRRIALSIQLDALFVILRIKQSCMVYGAVRLQKLFGKNLLSLTTAVTRLSAVLKIWCVM